MGRSGHRKGLGLLWLMGLLCLPGLARGAVETVSLPVTLEYPFIRSVVLHQLYNAPGKRAIVIDEDRVDCVRIELSNPDVGREQSLLKVGSDITIRAGVPFLDHCVGQLEWEGYIEVLQRPLLDDQRWLAHFKTVESRVYTRDRRPASLVSRLWDLIKAYVHPYLDRTNIELSPPLREIREFLPLVFPLEERQRVHAWLETLRLGPVQMEETALKVNLLLDVQTTRQPSPAASLPAAEIDHLSRAWEQWDAFLVFQIGSLIGHPVVAAERVKLLEILLENRYEFLQALESRTVNRDLVRRQFIWTWRNLAQILRKYLITQGSRPSLSYLAFFTASDALVALDRLGPSLGVEISGEGLVRLAKLLSDTPTDPVLTYSYTLDPELRTFLGFGPPLEDGGPASGSQEIDLPEGQELGAALKDRRSWIGQFLLPLAWAGETPSDLLAQIRPWLPTQKNADLYLARVKTLLEGAADRIAAAENQEGGDGPFFRLLTLATAWQESCWRQFLVQKGKIRYLVSYNRSSVGLMQINERVWRGIYRVESLRWNIAYNAKAGCEILHFYLRNFVLRELKPASPADFDTAARIAYAMYNGGPGQLKEYAKRSAANSLYQSDRLFWEKYLAAKEGRTDALAVCVAER